LEQDEELFWQAPLSSTRSSQNRVWATVLLGTSATVEPSACVGTTEARLDSVAENVALQ